MSSKPAELTQKFLQSILTYDPLTGIFTRRAGRTINLQNARMDFTYTCTGTKKSYNYVTIQNKRYLAHRLAFLYMLNCIPPEVDHIDGDGTNNIWENLRSITHSDNLKNAKLRSDNTSGIRGVSWHKRYNDWNVTIYVNKKPKYLGRSSDFFEACCLRKRAELTYNYPGVVK